MLAKLNSRLSCSLLLLIALLFPLVSYAQYSGNIQGVISDPAGAAINGATVQLLDVDTGVSSVTRTTDSGNFRFSSLPPGNYVVTANADGFRKTESRFALNTSETKGVNFTLAVASSQQTITVEEAPPAVDTDDSRLQATLSSDTVRDLPEANRNLWDVLAVAPGVVGYGTRAQGESPGGGADNFGTQTPQISANGRSYTGNLVMVDGMNVTSPIQNGIILAPIPDAVQEATLQTNSWDGEDNLGSSILIQVTTKSGTNQFHGTGSLFFTNQHFQATPEFTGPGAFLPFARKDLVGTLGGPIRKGKTFFFADFEKLWATTSAAANTGTQYFEDPAFVQWAPSNYANTVGTHVLAGWPASRLKPNGTVLTAQQYLGAGNCGTTNPLTPPCNLNMVDAGSFAASPYFNALQYNFRVDEYFTQNDRLYLSYYNDSFDQQQLSQRLTARSISRIPGTRISSPRGHSRLRA